MNLIKIKCLLFFLSISTLCALQSSSEIYSMSNNFKFYKLYLEAKIEKGDYNMDRDHIIALEKLIGECEDKLEDLKNRNDNSLLKSQISESVNLLKRLKLSLIKLKDSLKSENRNKRYNILVENEYNIYCISFYLERLAWQI